LPSILPDPASSFPAALPWESATRTGSFPRERVKVEFGEDGEVIRPPGSARQAAIDAQYFCGVVKRTGASAAVRGWSWSGMARTAPFASWLRGG
jgi:hypothetical protein